MSAPDGIDGIIYIRHEKELEVGGFYEVEITGFKEYDLYGTIKE